MLHEVQQFWAEDEQNLLTAVAEKKLQRPFVSKADDLTNVKANPHFASKWSTTCRPILSIHSFRRIDRGCGEGGKTHVVIKVKESWQGILSLPLSLNVFSRHNLSSA